MEEKIVTCKECGEFIGVETKNGMMVGNAVLVSFDGYCPNCEKVFFYQLELLKENYIRGMVYETRK